MSDPPAAVLAHYPAEVARLRWERLEHAGGFSGAVVWCGDDQFALKSWPSSVTISRLKAIHAAMEQACFPYVPHVLRTTTGDSVVSWNGRVHDLTTWAMGRPRTGEELSDDHLDSAMSALAAIHRAWAKERPSNAICPGVIRRLTVLEQVLSRDEPIPALSVVASRAARILRDWLARPMPLQLCLRDVHAQHILFTGTSVTGVIDFGAVDWDHPAVDLARYLGDTVGTTPERLKQGVRLYQQAGGPFSHTFDDEFVLVLADAGLVGSVLRWLTHPPRTPAQWRRMQTLLSRLEARAATA